MEAHPHAWHHRALPNDGRAAILDGGGTLWRSGAGSVAWRQIAQHVPYALGLAIV